MNAIAARDMMSEFYTRVSQDRELTSRYVKAIDGKHSREAMAAIAAFAGTLGFSLTAEDVAAAHLPQADAARQ